MSDERNEVERKARLDMESSAAGPSQIQHSAAAADPLTSPILKLDVDCFEELFEWLSLSDLRALRQTCKRLKQVVDYYIKTNYPAVKIGFGCITLNRESDFDLFKKLDPVKVKMIKEADLHVLTDEMIDDIKGILPQLERLNSFQVEFETNFYESILKWCSNLKYLDVCCMVFNKENPDEDSHWLKHLLPTVENLKIYYDKDPPTDNLIHIGTFLQLNPNIQNFSTSPAIFKSHGNCFFESNIKIDRLNVCIESDDEVDETCRILDILYEQGFHKRLHLFVHFEPRSTELDRITLTHGLEKLNLLFDVMDTQYTLPTVPYLRELCFDKYCELNNFDMDSIARNLTNLERVYFRYGYIDTEIISFIRYARNVTEIKVGFFASIHLEYEIIDLSALNEERRGLAGACKVTIYVEEEIFLKMKFATTKTEFDLVTLKRAEAVEWMPDEFCSF